MNKIDILIVDDVKDNHLVMESVLTSERINIINAMSGEQALKLCMTHDFAVVLMDVQMPGMDGFEAAALLRKIEKTKRIPIIFVTAISKEQKSIFKGYEIGAVDYLFKPIDPMILKSKVNVFIELFIQRKMLEDLTKELQEKIVELSQINDEKKVLSDLSEEDFLTNVYNRRGLYKSLNRHWINCSGYRLPYSLMMIDLDNFKRYNDNYGHLQGDSVLQTLAREMKKGLLRHEDFIGRYGGEEFLIGLPNTNLSDAITIANRIIIKIRELGITHGFNDPYDNVTVSIGIGTMIPAEAYQVDDLIKVADDMLYKAKASGKNCIKYQEIATVD